MKNEIVSLILQKRNWVLVERRKRSRSNSPGTVIFPAGHIEKGETREEALNREMREELGIMIHDPKLVYCSDFTCEEEQRIYWYTCKSYSGTIQKAEAAELFWIRITEEDILTHQVSRDALSAYIVQSTSYSV